MIAAVILSESGWIESIILLYEDFARAGEKSDSD